MEEGRLKSLRELEERLGYRFKKIELLDKALTHPSFVNEKEHMNKSSNEVLEFIGDAVLNLAISHLLLRYFPDAQEGMLSTKRAHIIKKDSLALLSKEIKLDEYLLLGKGEVLNGGRKKPSILANAYEALFGALYMDGGLERVIEILQNLLETYLSSKDPLFFNDYKSLFQEISQRVYRFTPKYRVIQELGPDHDKRYQASVSIQGEIKGVGWGRSKKEAEQEAAKKALKEFKFSNNNFRTE